MGNTSFYGGQLFTKTSADIALKKIISKYKNNPEYSNFGLKSMGKYSSGIYGLDGAEKFTITADFDPEKEIQEANRFLKESPEESIEPSLKKYIDEVGIEKVLRIISKAYSGTIEKPNEILKIINNAVKDIEFAKLN